MARRPGSVAFFGEFGTENLGNDGTLAVVLDAVGRRAPELEPFVVCVHPEPVEKQLGVRAVSVSGPRLTERGARRPGTLVNRVGGKLVDALWRAWTVRDASAVIIPGTGLFEDAEDLKPWSTPWMLASMAAGARVRGIPFAVFGVGVSPPTTAVKAALFRFTLRSASFRTFRDEDSREAARRLGVATLADPVHPDPCFLLPPAPRPATAGRSRVGLGVMHYEGPSPSPQAQAQAAQAYEDAMVEVGAGLVDRGHDVTLLTGESRDEQVGERVRSRLAGRAGTAGVEVVLHRAPDLTDLLDTMAGLDAVAATRYHNIICALIDGLPTLAVVYAPKNRAALAWAGRADDCVDIETLDPTDVLTRLDALLADRRAVSEQIATTTAGFRQRVEDQIDTLLTRVLPTHRPNGGTP